MKRSQSLRSSVLIFTVSIGSIGLFSACDKTGTDFSMMGTSQSFVQTTSTSLNNQIDILWVVDNSGSMQPFQQNLVDNFGSFISNFKTLGYDFHMSVTTSDAYLSNAKFNGNNYNSSLSKFVDGTNATGHSGFFILDALTPNLNTVFLQNALQGANGAGDERVFSSFREALHNPLNAGFLRSNSFLSVIILSDEDDFSGNNRAKNGGVDHSYTAATLDPVSIYVADLDALTNSTADRRRYNVSAITVMDNTCLTAHRVAAPSSIIGQRYIDLANATKGNLGSICDTSFADSLVAIQNRISELSSQFYLTRPADVTTLTVVVNGISVPQDAQNGWTYDPVANSVIFHGSSIPAQGANVQIDYTPTTVTN